MSKNLKEICNDLSTNNCYYRQPKSYFHNAIGVETTNMLVKKGYLVDSPKIENIGDFDEPCYEFSKMFRWIFNYHTNTVWVFIKYYIIYYSFYHVKEWFSEKFGH